MSERSGFREFAHRMWEQLPLLLALVILWMLLWGTVDLLSITTGVVVALLVTNFFYLPPVGFGGRLNPVRLLTFLVWFAVEVTVASFLVAAQAFGPRVRGNAVIAVPLRTRSDFILSMTGAAVALVPGSIVIEVAREEATLYVHVFGAHDERTVERARLRVLDTETRIVRAIGSRDDLERVTR